MIRGIDVSNHQERIDWTRVAGDGVGFAFVKATEGVDFIDPKAGAHAAGARAAGIPCGFYHFARPDTHTGSTAESARRDARAEADSFLAAAAPKPGDLLPVLDLETPGLRPALLLEWTKAWLERVEARIGARPMLYTYPSFWPLMGNTRALGTYRLWIANYGVSAPRLPPGWSRYAIWQYTSSGGVPGIPGRVDMNRLHESLALADLTLTAAPEGELTTPPAQNLPGPVPKPDWFWPWLRWHLGRAEFEGLARNESVRPDEAPESIPDWAWACARKLESERRRG